MTRKRHILTNTMMFVLLGLLVAIPQVDAVDVYTANVEWTGYNFSSDTNCGDANWQTCENKLTVKRTTSSSCSSKSWLSGVQKNNFPGGVYLDGYYILRWSRTGGYPCLTFDVKIVENSAGDSTSLHTYTISTSGTTSKTLDLIIGTANGYFKIRYWVTIDSGYD